MEILSTGLKPEAGDDRNGVHCERFNYQLQLVPTTPEKNTWTRYLRMYRDKTKPNIKFDSN